MPLDCYFFMDLDEHVPEEERCLSTLCVSCREQHYPDTGWFYNGEKEGYGPWEIRCQMCDAIINEEPEDDDETED